MAKVQQSKKPEDVVEPIIVVDGEREHVLKTLFRDEKAPVLKSVGFAHIPGSSGFAQYVSYTIMSQGDKILNIEVSLPNLKKIAEDEAKTAFVSTFLGDEL